KENSPPGAEADQFGDAINRSLGIGNDVPVPAGGRQLFHEMGYRIGAASLVTDRVADRQWCGVTGAMIFSHGLTHMIEKSSVAGIHAHASSKCFPSFTE